MQRLRDTAFLREKVTMNDCGVITIPVRLRKAFGLKPHAEFIAESVAEGILLRPSISIPIEIYTEERMAGFAHDDEAIDRLLPPLP
jgi:bifunctional DNA-binding transcriptional regulator/antitoxin component of YhaV-PrlF toxin-antitoxin module